MQSEIPVRESSAVARLLADPDFLPFDIDLEGGRALFVRLDRAQRNAAPFLDQRALNDGTEGVWIPIVSLSDADGEPRASCDFIFHMGHVGSTLVSRLIASWPAMQVLREPQALKTIARHADPRGRMDDSTERVLNGLLKRLAWPQPPHVRVLVKASSSCNNLIEPLLTRNVGTRALLVQVGLESYLATLLKSPVSIADAAASAPTRYRYLAAEIDKSLPELSSLDDASLCAMCWLSDHIRYRRLASGPLAARVKIFDFEEVLASPAAALGQMAQMLDLDAAGVAAAVESEWWHRYSKSGAHAYSPSDRTHDQALARQRFGNGIAAGRRWVQSVCPALSV